MNTDTNNYERMTQCLLRHLGVNGSYIGFHYVTYGTVQAIQNPELLGYISKGLYSAIAAHFHTTEKCVERDIRTVKNVIWVSGSRDMLNIVFNRELRKTPHNAEFIDALANYVAYYYTDFS